MRKALLKIYSFALLVILLFSYKSVTSENPTVFDYLDIAFSGVAYLGLASYSFSLGIGRPRFWGGYFYVIVLWDIIYNFVITYWLKLAQNIVAHPAPFHAFLLTILVLIPEYLALYKFGKMEPDAVEAGQG